MSPDQAPTLDNQSPSQITERNDPGLKTKLQSSKNIRFLSVALFFASLIVPINIIALILWLTFMKQYQFPAWKKILIFVTTVIVGPVLFLLGLFAGLDTENYIYPFIILGIVLMVAPYLYSIIWPFGAHKK